MHTEAGADGRSKRHHGSSAGVDEFARGDQIVIRIRQNDEAFLHENARCLDELLCIRKKRLLVPNHFKLDPI